MPLFTANGAHGALTHCICAIDVPAATTACTTAGRLRPPGLREGHPEVEKVAKAPKAARVAEAKAAEAKASAARLTERPITQSPPRGARRLLRMKLRNLRR